MAPRLKFPRSEMGWKPLCTFSLQILGTRCLWGDSIITGHEVCRSFKLSIILDDKAHSQVEIHYKFGFFSLCHPNATKVFAYVTNTTG